MDVISDNYLCFYMINRVSSIVKTGVSEQDVLPNQRGIGPNEI